MAEKWAQHCAKLETGASGFIYEATQEYAAKKAEGWSVAAIAREVTEAGFPIGTETVRRRINALAKIGDSTVDGERAFAEAYVTENNKPWDERPTTMPKNEEGVAMVLEKAAKELQDKYDWTEDEVKQEIAAAKVKAPKAEPEPKKTRVDHNYDLFVDALELVRQAEPPISKRAQTKLQELGLEVDILREEEATV